ncbi:hypothetical protein [Vibrio sp. D431a]|uniref:hypothetical protein n=1 Tax=Vibrio sp. D431a TaxID=2837388 RepID=UPI00255715A8|nr:hypothetical protein [Vibrio sp. D431a]MDK9790653.1 hypothetical protein [Vibrio sp. D431a]
MNQDKMMVKACVRSGMCCKKTPCGYGEWNEDHTQCAFLEVDDKGLHGCGKYEEISKDPNSIYSPAFGYGCCMSIGNSARDEIIQTHHNGVIPYVEIDAW